MEGQAPTLAPKKLKLSLGKEHRFNTYSPTEIQDACKSYTPYNTQRSTQCALRVSKTLMYCVNCSFYSFVSWGDNSYQLRDLCDMENIIPVLPLATYVTMSLIKGTKIESGTCMHFIICSNRSFPKSNSLSQHWILAKLTSCTVTAFYRNYNLVDVPNKLLFAKLSCYNIISNLHMKQVHKVPSTGPLCMYNTKQCIQG